MNTAINYKKNFVPPQPGTTWVISMTAVPMGAQTTTAAVVNVAVDADMKAAPAENNDAKIFDREDVSFDQWLQFQSWQACDKEGAQFMNISSEETRTDDLNLSRTWADIVKTPRSEGEREGVTILGPAVSKEGATNKKG